ncbi:MAG: M48 family metalloprotease [Bacteroidia bacterium]|nr:M48 family metalloprotease [Bacteroidia bacterium]
MKVYTQPLVATFLIAFFLILEACSVNPVTGKKEVMFVSEQQEIAMGQQADPSIVAQFGLYENEGLQNFINTKGQEMAAISHRSHLNYEFKILNSPVVNAFAVPGGYVYFTRGILAHFNNEAEFAGVLGHEIGHITARHSAKQQTQATLGQIGLIGAVVLSPTLASMGQSLSQGLQLLMLKYGRDAESQSDRLGVEYSTKIGYNSSHMANFFKTLARMREASGQEIPTFASTHPDPIDRFDNVHRLTQEWQTKLGVSAESLTVNRDQYLGMIDNLMYGEDPQEGYVADGYFFHPGLKWYFPVPRGWKVNNSPQAVQMYPEDGKALVTLTLGQGNSLEEVAQKVVEQNKLQVRESQRVTINGLPAIAMVSQAQMEQQGQQPVNLGVVTYLIQYNNLIYNFTGLSTEQDFNAYFTYLATPPKGFAELRDSRRINVFAERIKVRQVNRSGTLQQHLQSFGVPQSRLEEVAVLNSMLLSDQVPAGTMIKTIVKGSS